ncbi:MAG TPA: RnfABCDGE type electron transport complex subunit C [Spirochaetia bacterium]|nr:RnfABCDGE type electron transport complex subunit C [Spirochaetia bacterium]
MKIQRAFLSVGGVNPPSVKLFSGPVGNASIPAFALIPMLQHVGPPARCLVRAGDRVQEGMLIGKADGPRSANVHSPIPGTVVAVEQTQCADGTSSLAAIIEFGGEFTRTGKAHALTDWEKLSRSELLRRIESAGVVGLGGSMIPTHLKLTREPSHKVGILIGNGIESEPSLCGDVSLMREKSRGVAIGLRICQRILEATRVVLAIGQSNEEELAPLFREAFADDGAPWFEITACAARYPLGHEDLVRTAILSKGSLSNGSGKLDDGADCVVLNVATLYAIFEAVVEGRPLIERFVTVTGSAVRTPGVVKVRFGTRVGDLFEECGGLVQPPGKVVLGGPMRGISVSSLDFPVTKGVSGVVAFTKAESRSGPQLPCIHCGACVEACPWGLVPTRLHKLIEQGNTAAALSEGLSSCTECGCCAFACPSRIPLVDSLRRGKRLASVRSDG